MTTVLKISFPVHMPGACASKTMHPAVYSRVHIIKTYLNLERSMHVPDAHVPTPLHLATKLCTLGAGYTLNFEH